MRSHQSKIQGSTQHRLKLEIKKNGQKHWTWWGGFEQIRGWLKTSEYFHWFQFLRHFVVFLQNSFFRYKKSSRLRCQWKNLADWEELIPETRKEQKLWWVVFQSYGQCCCVAQVFCRALLSVIKLWRSFEVGVFPKYFRELFAVNK